MERFPNLLQRLSSLSKQKQTHKEERKPFLSHSYEPTDSGNGCGEVRVSINRNSDDSKQIQSASSSHGGSASHSSGRSSRFSFADILTEAIYQERRNLPDHQNNANFRLASWKSLVNKTKSRLIDPTEEQGEESKRIECSGGLTEEVRDHDDEDGIRDITDEYKRRNCNIFLKLQWATIALILAALLFSISVPVTRKQVLWDLPLWRWEIMLLTLICGHLVTGLVIRVIVIFIEHNFLLRKRVLYFVYGLRRAIQNSLWLGLVFLIWHLMLDGRVFEEWSKSKSRIVPYITKILTCLFVGNLIWLLKTLMVKVLALSFHVSTFFERLQEALFNQYVIETLSGPALEPHNMSENKEGSDVGNYHVSPKNMANREGKDIPNDRSREQNQKNGISAWNMRRMINTIRRGSLSTLDEQILDSHIEDESLLNIRTVFQAKEAAKKIFYNVAKPESQYIYLEDLMRFLSRAEAMRTLRHLGATTEKEGVRWSLLNEWMVNAFKERRALSLSLNDTKTAVKKLHNMLNVAVAVLVTIIWFLILGIPIMHVVVLISSQLVLAAFIFGDTCKTVFEAIVFLFVMHPFDVGDRCEVNGVQLIVEEMNILTTVFIRHDGQKVTYPNSILATKCIGNFYRSPHMGETINFCIHISTPLKKISILKERIKQYVESKNHHWYAAPTVIVKDVEDMNRINMSIWVTHKMNHQNMKERWVRRTLLVEEMIRIFKEMEIEYRLLPLDVNIRNMSDSISSRLGV